jgi:hypothetical protein
MEHLRTPHQAFWIPILTVLNRNADGSATSEEVYEYVYVVVCKSPSEACFPVISRITEAF